MYLHPARLLRVSSLICCQNLSLFNAGWTNPQPCLKLLNIVFGTLPREHRKVLNSIGDVSSLSAVIFFIYIDITSLAVLVVVVQA